MAGAANISRLFSFDPDLPHESNLALRRAVASWAIPLGALGPDRLGAGHHVSGLGSAPDLPQKRGVVSWTHGQIRLVRPEPLLPDGQCAPIQRLGLSVAGPGCGRGSGPSLSVSL